jgi:hypothetical protein
MDGHPLMVGRKADPPWRRIQQLIDRGIRKWDKLLLRCSKHSQRQSSWVDKEIVTALEKRDEFTQEQDAKERALVPYLDG